MASRTLHVMRNAAPLLLLAVLAAGAGCTTRFEVDGARAHARVVHQVEAGPRVPGSAAHAAIGDWIEAELTRLGGRVEVQRAMDSTLAEPVEVRNIVGRFGPDDGRPLALCAHWDSRAWCDQDPDPAYHDTPVPGANDGGSGVAVLFEVAELMAKRPPSVPVMLVFFDVEDQGRGTLESYCIGSQVFAARYEAGEGGERPRAAFVFDMVGDRHLNIEQEANSLRRAANLVEVIGEAARATGARGFIDRPGRDVFDDHVPLLDAGIPAADIIDIDYDAWHTHEDTPDRVAPESLAEVARVAAWIVYRSPFSRPLRP